MRIRFYISTYDPNRWGDDCIGSEPTGHNSYTQQRHMHELYDMKEMFREEYREFCYDNHHNETRTMLIDIPDDIGFQFMMQGIQDNDYLVYNVYTEMYAFGTNLDSTDNMTHNNGSNGVSLKGSWGGSTDTQMIEWSLPDRGNKKTKREQIIILVEDAFYSNLHEYCLPIIEHWAYTKYYQIATDLNTVLSNKEENNIRIREKVVVPEDPDSRKAYLNFSIDGLNFLFFQYVNDGDLFLAVQDEMSSYHLDFFRRMYVHLHRKNTQAPE